MSSNPHACRRIFFAALVLKDLHVKNLPMRLRVQLSIASIRPASEISMTSVSSTVGTCDFFFFFLIYWLNQWFIGLNVGTINKYILL